MKIIIETIPFVEQRYPTAGDWYYDNDGVVLIKVTDMGNWFLNFLIAIHELVEFALCKRRGISPETVDKFDMAHLDLDDPGSHPFAPYKLEHFHATNIERLVSEQLGIDFEGYEDRIEEVCK